MKLLTLVFVGIVAGLLDASATTPLSGMYGQTLSGICVPTYPGIRNMQNTANLSSPQAVVQDGPEFTATFTDVFSQQWQCNVDFLDNYQVVFQFSSPNPNANIGGPQLIQWHFSEFNFTLGDLQKVSVPQFPYDDRSIPSFDSENVWMGFDALAAYPPVNSFTYQLVPVPEPQTVSLLALGGMLVTAGRRWRGRIERAL